MANQGKIRFGVEFQSNTSGLKQAESSLNTILGELQKISSLSVADLQVKGLQTTEEQLKDIQKEAKELESIFSKSYNFKLNTVDYDKLKANLEASNKTLASFELKMQQLGPQGAKSIAHINAALNQTQTILREAHPLMDKMKETFANTIRWTIASTAINAFTGSIQKAWSFTKQLDSSLNDIQVVTGKNAEAMDVFATKANNAAKALGTSTKSYAQASLIYYQQGLSDKEVEARTNVTAKVANVTGQSAQSVSEQLTAVWNGYKVQASEAELYIDKLSAVAAKTAADLEELSTGMSKVASAANIMGVDVDQLNAQLATIVSVTREAPESIGTALKTVYARMSDIQAGIDGEVSLDEYTKQMAEMGINVLNAKGQLRDMGEVVEEIGSNWNNLTRAQQVSLAQTVAGTRQYSRMMALFDNWDMYEDAKKTSQESAGTLESQNEIKLDSLEKKLEQLSATTESLYMALFDNDSFKGLIDGLTTVVELTAKFIENLGGARSLLLLIGGIAAKSFSNKIGDFVGTTIKNRANNKLAKEQVRTSVNEVQSIEQAIYNKSEEGQQKWKTAKRDQLAIGKELKSLSRKEISAKQNSADLIEDYAYSEGESFEDGSGALEALKEESKILDDIAKKRDHLTKTENNNQKSIKDQVWEDEAKYRDRRKDTSVKELEEELKLAKERAQVDKDNARARKFLSDEEYRARIKNQEAARRIMQQKQEESKARLVLTA